jgi:capsular polysaccharide transport system ATP-binding protein
MITLRAVTKYVGRGAIRNVVLDDIDLAIPRKARMVILGQRGAGKSTLLQVIGGMQLPDGGQVERRASVSPPAGLVRYARSHGSTRQLAGQLAQIYRMDPNAILEFVKEFVDIGNVLEHPVMSLPGPLRQQLDYALIFAIPFDFYLFDERVSPAVPTEFRDACLQALQERLRDSGLVFATSSVRLARQFDASAAILHSGKLSLFPSVEEAIEVFQQLPPSVGHLDMRPPAIEEDEEFG